MTWKKSKRIGVLFFADTHAGHRYGLLSPSVKLYAHDKNGKVSPYAPELTEYQTWLWECWNKDLGSAFSFFERAPVVVCQVGDPTQGKKYPEHQFLSRANDQIVVASENVKPILKHRTVKSFRLYPGTSSHEHGEGAASLQMERELQPRYKDVEFHFSRHGILPIGNTKIDIAHHGPTPGSRVWTDSNAAFSYLKNLMLKDLLRGKVPPDLVIRAHFHQLVVAECSVCYSGKIYTSKIIVLPSYCGPGEYSTQATRSEAYAYIGMVAAEVVDGELGRIKYFYRDEDLRTEEKL